MLKLSQNKTTVALAADLFNAQQRTYCPLFNARKWTSTENKLKKVAVKPTQKLAQCVNCFSASTESSDSIVLILLSKYTVDSVAFTVVLSSSVSLAFEISASETTTGISAIFY